MPSVLTTVKAVDRSTFIVTASFTDAQGDDVIPASIAWTLTDDAGTVINSRENVNVAVPAASIDILLQGDDLAVADSSTRLLTLNAVYNSDEGSNLPLRDQVRFTVQDLTAVA